MKLSFANINKISERYLFPTNRYGYDKMYRQILCKCKNKIKLFGKIDVKKK